MAGILHGRPWWIAVRLEATGALLLAALLVHVLPLRVTRRWFGTMVAPDLSGTTTTAPPVTGRAQDIGRRLRWTADHLPWTSTCLVRAVALGLLLKRRGIKGWSIRFGVSKTGGVLAAHAWMMMGADILIGGEEAASFVPLADLGTPKPVGTRRDG